MQDYHDYDIELSDFTGPYRKVSNAKIFMRNSYQI